MEEVQSTSELVWLIGIVGGFLAARLLIDIVWRLNARKRKRKRMGPLDGDRAILRRMFRQKRTKRKRGDVIPISRIVKRSRSEEKKPEADQNMAP